DDDAGPTVPPALWLPTRSAPTSRLLTTQSLSAVPGPSVVSRRSLPTPTVTPTPSRDQGMHVSALGVGGPVSHMLRGTASAPPSVGIPPQFSLDLLASTSEVGIGTLFSYSLSVFNDSETAATITVRDRLDSALELISANAS